MASEERASFRLLDLSVSLEWPPALDRLGLPELVRFVVPRASLASRPGSSPIGAVTGARATTIRFGLGATGLYVVTDGVRVVEGLDAVSAVDAAYGAIHRLAFEGAAAQGWTRLHGAVADLPGARIVIVGSPGAGKSTLVAQLLLAGVQVSGDEWLLARHGEVLAFPRRFQLDASAIDVLPGLASRWPNLATMPASDRREVGDGLRRAIDPTDLGRAWTIDARPVDVLAFLTTRQPGPNVVRAMSALRAAELLMAQVFDDAAPIGRGTAGSGGSPARSRGRAVREVCTLVNEAMPLAVAVNDLGSIANDLGSIAATLDRVVGGPMQAAGQRGR